MSEILSQEEIDALLSAYSSGAQGGRSSEKISTLEVRLYDFARPERFSKEQVRQLEAVHTSFATSLTNHLSAVLRTTVDIRHTTLDQANFDEYLKSIPSPTLLSSFRLDPTGTRCLLEMNPNIVFALVDLMTGGHGEAHLHTRGMTEIEVRLMDGVVRAALNEYARAWDPFAKISCELDRVGSNQMANPIANSQDPMLSSYFEARIGAQVGLISLCAPVLTVDSIFLQFSGYGMKADPAVQTAASALIANNLSASSVQASAVLGRARVTLRELVGLQEGDLVRLEQPLTDEIRMSIQGIPKFRAVPGVVGRKLGVHITGEIDDSGI